MYKWHNFSENIFRILHTVMRRTILVFLITIMPFIRLYAQQPDIVDHMALNFKNGNAKEIAKNFAPTLELIVINEEDVYSKAQAEQILGDFFNRHKPFKSSILYNIGKTAVNRFAVIVLYTNNGDYRISITMKKGGTSYVITELRIEPAKD